MQLYTAIEQGLEQIHYDSRFTAYLITIRNCKRKAAVVRYFQSINRTDVYLKIQNGRKSKTKVVCKYQINNKTIQEI